MTIVEVKGIKKFRTLKNLVEENRDKSADRSNEYGRGS